MAINIEMPKLSETMTEGILLRWNKQVGDFVDVGEIIAEVETDKATISVECFDDGYLIEQCVEEGKKVPVGEIIAKLDSSMPEQNEKKTLPVNTPMASSQAVKKELPRRCSSPLARKLAAKGNVNLSVLEGKGSGPKGRIMAGDVRNLRKEKPNVSQAPPAVTEDKKTAQKQEAQSPLNREEKTVVPLSQRQKFIAEVTASAKSNTPHYYVTIEADVSKLEKLREQVNNQAAKTHGNHFTFNDFILRALIDACKVVPSANSSFDEEGQAIIHHNHIGINVAVDAHGSVLIPVLKDAQSKSMMQLSSEMRDLAERARTNKLRPADFDGGTITLTNLGARGVDHFYGIINTPQAAIVSIGAIVEKPVVRKQTVAVGQCVSISMSCDHRVMSGLDAARFLEEMKTLIETPTLLLV